MADRRGFEEFVAARSPRLLRVGYLLTQDWGEAEDLLQTALAKAWLHWGAIDEPEAYLRAVIANTYASWWRRRWRGEVPTEYLPEGAAADATPNVDERDQMWAALGRLPRRRRRSRGDRAPASVPASGGAGVCRRQPPPSHWSRSPARSPSRARVWAAPRRSSGRGRTPPGARS